MKFAEKASKLFHSRISTFIAFLLSLFAFIFIKGADWTYGWIAASYPLGNKFIPTLLTVIAVSAAANYICLFIRAYLGQKGNNAKIGKAIGVIQTVFFITAIITFIYSFVLIFGLDTGFSASKFAKGMNAVKDMLIFVSLGGCLGTVLVFCSGKKKAVGALICSVVVCGIVSSIFYFSGFSVSTDSSDFIQCNFSSENLLDGASVEYESLKKGEKADAANILNSDNTYWSAQNPNRSPADGTKDINNSFVQIKLKSPATFNTAVIEEIGNEVQYFRLQAFINDEWVTVYRSEKMQSMRICSFDAVTTDKIRLSVDKFRNNDIPAKIKSIKLYNEKSRDAENFEVTAYQRLDGDIPTEILAKGDEYVKNYAKFYDVYSTIIVFAAVQWDENGDMNFGSKGEDYFAEQIAALKTIIGNRSNPEHQVKLIVTALADGAWGDGHNGVNTYMASNWEKVANQIVDMARKYDFDGVDIDWEYPVSTSDWSNYDNFIQKLSRDLKAYKPDSIISTALSSGQLGISKETYECIDQIQFMAYDGNDQDGYQSSLEQAEDGLRTFKANGADISKINIGIAAYGRPVNGSPYWAVWRTLKDADYYNNKYYTVEDSDQIYEGTFCSPALAGDKTAYALLSGAGGVMVFRVACDKTPDDPNSVSNGIKNTLNRYVNNW